MGKKDIEDFKVGDTVDSSDVFNANFEPFEWVKNPTHIPKQQPVALYGIEVVDATGDPAPFIAHPKQFKDRLN